jgi:lipoprotein signal peptidase
MLHIKHFKPVFNIADMAISAGVLCIILGYRHFFQHNERPQTPEKEEVEANVEI